MAVKGFKAQKRKRAKKIGFLVRQSTPNGKNLILRRRRKGRARLAA